MAIDISRDHIDRFRAVIARVYGLDFDENRFGHLDAVMRGRLQRVGRDAAGYLEWLETRLDAAELRALVGQLTVSETYFFRHLDQYRALAEVVIPERMAAQRTSRQLRLLSLGCASGEEAFSLAMFARETVPDSWTVSIRAVDVSPEMIARARSGRFSAWALRETPARQRDQWFRSSGREFVLDESVRSSVQFEERNLAADDPSWWQAGTFDVVFCRNLLMYFTPAQAERLVGRIGRVLCAGGYLFLGHAETLRGLSTDFHLCHTHNTFYYQRKDAVGVTSQPLDATRVSAEPPPALDQSLSWVEAIRHASERVAAMTSQPAPARPRAVPAAAASGVSVAVELLRQDRFGEALSLVDALPAEVAGDAEALLLRAVLLTHGGNLADAEATCRRLLEVDDMNAGAHYLLALCRDGECDYEGARSHDQIASYLDPGFAMPRLHLGLLARRAGERDEARQELGQALVLLQREDSPRILLFGGGFTREALMALCRTELHACGGIS